jgi:hypothetical protein
MFKDCEGKIKEHLVEHLLEPAPAPFMELWTISKTVEHQATLLGSAWGFLAGAHEGLKFGPKLYRRRVSGATSRG